MGIRFYNTLTQRLEDFEPLEPGKASIYVCGITTYDVPHAGHGRTYTTFDVLTRFLKVRGYAVTHVRNVTDVDDKIMKRAGELGEDPLALSLRMSQVADGDLASIGCAPPDHAPRVSTSIEDIVALIEKIIAKEHAYVAKTPKGNDVYFSVRSFPPYGKLSHRKIDDLMAGARIEVGEIKKDPLDFALWKGDESPDALGWPSPWGKGRPGWHIECSAMSQRWLGEHFDIHAGGMDLIFPHHENEVAQSESVHGPPMSKYWLHGGFLEIDKEKMAKSLGNFVTIRDVLERNDPEAFRYYLLGTHYRGPLAFEVEKTTDDGKVWFPPIDEAERRVDYLYNTYAALKAAAGGEAPAKTKLDEMPEKLLAALDNDLNTPQALAVLADLAKAANDLSKQKNKKAEAAAAILALEKATAPLGLMLATPEEYFKRTQERRIRVRGIDPKEVDAKLAERQAARAAKDFAKGDAIRKELLDRGIEVLDGPTGSTWRVNQ